jgi:hypothetical protein
MEKTSGGGAGDRGAEDGDRGCGGGDRGGGDGTVPGGVMSADGGGEGEDGGAGKVHRGFVQEQCCLELATWYEGFIDFLAG